MDIKVLDQGYVTFVEAWGHGLEGDEDNHGPDHEVGIIEAARQSTQGSFRGWDPAPCNCDYPDRHKRANDTSFANGSRGVFDQPIEVSHQKDCASVKNPGDRKLLAFLHNHKHSTPFEFAGMVLEIQAPIMVFREWHRHRTQSYSEASARYAPLLLGNYHMTDEDLIARAKEAAESKNRQSSSTGIYDPIAIMEWNTRDRQLSQLLKDHYHEGLSIGVPKELARKKMPVDSYSRMRACCNLRNWLAFLTLRLDPAAQKEIRMYAEAVASLVDKHFPETFRLFQSLA